MEIVRERLDRVVIALRGAKVRYAVAGENAVAAWVSRVDESAVRTPAIVEIVLSREEFERARAAMEDAGFCYTIGGSWFHWFRDSSRTSRPNAVTLYIAREKLQPDFDCEVPDIDKADSSGPYVVLDLESLVRTNLAMYTFTDRVGVLDLINVGLVDESWLQRFTGETAARLKRLLDDPDKFDGFK